MERNLKLTLRFRGTAYHGYQVQKNAPSVAQAVQQAIFQVTGEHPQLKGCSRTDTGVHALAYVCSFRTHSSIPCRKLPLALNFHLPRDIAVLSCQEAPEGFHARYSAKGKEYRYLILNSPLRDPFYQDLAWQYAPPLDVERLSRWGQEFVGVHDFTSFCGAGGSVEDRVREITSFSVEREGPLVRFTVCGNGFLYHMVRIMVGTLISLGEGKLDRSGPGEILACRDRKQAGLTAPAQGLYLVRVFY